MTRSRQNKSALHIRFRDGGELLILGNKDTYLQKACNVAEMMSGFYDYAEAVEIDSRSPILAEFEGKGRALTELLWVLTSALLAAQKAEICKRTDVYRLSSWPNLTRLPHNSTAYSIAALLSRQPHSCRIIASKLKISIEDVHDFCAPALKCGHIEPVSKSVEVTAEELLPKASSSFLSSVLSRLQG
ncbi:hypothetical protein [Pseudomaricurvus sp. HS19]|uniref:hypothetical protein n=1 Tax=Pseudomaricurvus sp. HS19 TaxID=2692626 RepID=UPI00136FEAE6|nr:hypothetical protein [Pseudomaricurvus sp. HS19]MYM65099.1 hypothetical protein [Pseudomaricurvus sp. HS19]